MTTTDLAAENARLRAKIEELTDRVCADIDARSDAQDLRRELDAMRQAWADLPPDEHAAERLRTRMREWFPDYEFGGYSVAMPAATAHRLVTQLEEWRTQVDALLAREAARAYLGADQ